MASVHQDRRSKSKFWIGAYTDQFGRQRKQSTKLTDRKKAQAVADGWEEASKLARQGDLTEQTARDVLNHILLRAGQKPIYYPTIKVFLQDWLALEKGSEDPNSQSISKKELAVRLFVESLGDRCSIPLKNVQESDIVRFRQYLLAKGRRPITANALVRSILGQAFRHALDKGLIQRNPIAKAKKQHGNHKIEKGTFSPEQISRLVAAASGDWKGLILFAYFTGQRLSDLANLKWESITVNNTLRIRQRKTGALVEIPLRAELSEYLESVPSNDSNDAPVFPSLYGVGTAGNSGLSRSFTRIMKKAGIVSAAIRERGEGVSRAVNALSFHSLRHSFNSAMLNAGVTQELRMKLTGHSSSAMNSIYSHHELETLRGALNQLPRLS